MKPVDPTDEEQDTGVKVTNPDEDTKVSAKDEDKNDVPVKIDEDGKVIVTPGEDVDGPINVTIEDPDLPGGKVEVEVPVNGHEKDRDDNGSDASEKTEVDSSGVKPVEPTDEKQDTGIKVTNPGEDTTVSATDEDGNKVPAEIDKDGNVVVTPGEDVDGPITVVVEDPDLDGGKAEIEVPVEGHEKGVDDNKKPAKPGKDLSSNLSQRCINTGLGVGIPLLFLIPVGLASQMNIPGLKDFVAPINKQIQNLNTQLQKQAGVFNGPLAGKVAGIDAQLKRFGADYQQVAGAVALIAAGALAIGLIADACAPGAGSSNGSSK